MTLGTVLSSLLAIILSLAFVIGLAWGVLWLLKRIQDGSFGKLAADPGGKTLRFERALPIGPRERLVLVEVDGEHMLLGVTAHSINQLKSWPIDPGDGGDELEADAAAPSGDGQETLAEKASRFRLRMAKGSDA